MDHIPRFNYSSIRKVVGYDIRASTNPILDKNNNRKSKEDLITSYSAHMWANIYVSSTMMIRKRFPHFFRFFVFDLYPQRKETAIIWK